MRKGQFAALLVLGTFVLFLGAVWSNSLTRLAEKPQPRDTRPAAAEEGREEPKSDSDVPPPGLDPAEFPDFSGAHPPRKQVPPAKGPDKAALSKLLRELKGTAELKLHNGRGEFKGEVTETESPYQGRRSYKALTVRLEAGKSYQIDLTSKAFQSFLFLEGPDGQRLKENSSPTIGGNSRVTYRAEKSGVHRIIATSLGGFRVGPFVCSVSLASSGADLPKAAASLLRELDKDGDGQIGLYEWPGSAEEFREFDLNGDGFITSDELLRYLRLRAK